MDLSLFVHHPCALNITCRFFLSILLGGFRGFSKFLECFRICQLDKWRIYKTGLYTPFLITKKPWSLWIWMQYSMMVSTMASWEKDNGVHLQANDLLDFKIMKGDIFTMNTSWPDFVWNGRDFSNCTINFLVSIFLSVMERTGHQPRTFG